MSPPFTLQQFLETFRAYNNAIGPAPLLLSLLASVLVVIAYSRAEWRHRAILLGLAALWIWSGFVYHLGFFSRINPAAKVFGMAFVAQGLFLAVSRLRFSPRESRFTLAGWALIAYALVVYPLLGWWQGHGYPAGPSFGAPCPTLIFFFGMLTWSKGKVPLGLLVIPVAWAAIGTSAATTLGITEDYGLAVAALVAVASVRRSGTTARTANDPMIPA